MVITWYGQSCFKIQSGELVIVIDPFDKKIGLVPPRQLSANVLLISHQHDDHNNTSTISGEPFIIDGPGEYEIKGVMINGIFSYHDNSEGAERGINTIYKIDLENIKICHLGDFGQKKLTDEQIDAIGDVDILMVPVGGIYTIDGSEAADVVNQIEPKIVIPMHYKIVDLNIDLNSVDKFLKEIGAGDKEPMDKLTIKKKDLPVEGMDIVVLKV